MGDRSLNGFGREKPEILTSEPGAAVSFTTMPSMGRTRDAGLGQSAIQSIRAIGGRKMGNSSSNSPLFMTKPPQSIDAEEE